MNSYIVFSDYKITLTHYEKMKQQQNFIKFTDSRGCGGSETIIKRLSLRQRGVHIPDASLPC